jgi:Fic family protein
LHRRLFATVRGHNGKVRARGFGEEHPIIMGKRAPPRDKVPQLLESFLQKAEQRIARLERSSAAECIRVAVELHTGLVAMQPFHDGNKRTARALLDVVLVRLGFPGVVFSVPRADYVTATRAGMDGDHSILVDLVLVLLTDALPTN